MTQNEKVYFKVVGMYCITCKPIAEKQLKDEKAIKKVDVNYMTDSIVVEFDPVLITKEQIRSRLEKSGYKFIRVAR
ncbi:MAG: cation transporter [Thermoproteota archaeon]|nr:cation transporter [Thermoproteota archaeon]